MIDTITAARELGKALQNSPEYTAMKAAEKACDADASLQELIGDFNLVRMNLTQETAKSEKDDAKIAELNASLQKVYTDVMGNEHMMNYNIAKQDVEAIMQKVNTVLQAAINGDDVDAVDVEAAGCTGSCSSCAGCH
jgi:cell fate (sporulation/competence/biofilm development) regulator YlbF (YheA/YmcA/DUF963 family)